MFDSHPTFNALTADPGIDIRRDFAAVMLLATAQMRVTTPAGRPRADLATLLAPARARPDMLSYGIVGNSSLANVTRARVQRPTGVRLSMYPIAAAGH